MQNFPYSTSIKEKHGVACGQQSTQWCPLASAVNLLGCTENRLARLVHNIAYGVNLINRRNAATCAPIFYQ